MAKFCVGFTTDYECLEERFKVLLNKRSDVKPFRLFSVAWHEVAFYKVLWGRKLLANKVELYHELFDSLVNRLQTDVDLIDNMLKTGGFGREYNIFDPEITVGLAAMASVLFTVYGIYANIPANHKLSTDDKFCLTFRIRFTLALNSSLTDLLSSLLRTIASHELPENHKIRRLVEETMVVFTRLKNSQALNVHIFPHLQIIGEKPMRPSAQGKFT